jgi:hypothetical protein
MPSELDIATLAAEVERLVVSDAHRWTIARAPGVLRVHLRLTPVGFPDVYCLRLDYGEALAAGPPSTTFCDPASLAEGRLEDWPAGLTEYFKTPPGNGVGWICNPWTREGRVHHAEWRAHGWHPNRAIWTVATAVQDILDKPGAYTGRAK